MDFAVGTYFVRVNGDANRENSKPTEITISEGGKVKLTFVIDGATVAERELAWNETLTDIPAIPERDGYTAMWSVTNFTNISRDKTVTAIYTKIGETPVIPDEELPEGDESSGTLPGGDENGSENKDTERATESEKTTQTDMDEQTSTDTDASAPTESGCGASAFGGVAAIISVAVGFAVFKKKED
jgi:hypothetical protein